PLLPADRAWCPAADRGLLRLGRRGGDPPGTAALLRGADPGAASGGAELYSVIEALSGAGQGWLDVKRRDGDGTRSRDEGKQPVRSLAPSKPRTGPAPPRRSVCAPG